MRLEGGQFAQVGAVRQPADPQLPSHHPAASIHLCLAQAVQLRLLGLDGLGVLGGCRLQLGHLGLQGRRCRLLRWW